MPIGKPRKGVYEYLTVYGKYACNCVPFGTNLGPLGSNWCDWRCISPNERRTAETEMVTRQSAKMLRHRAQPPRDLAKTRGRVRGVGSEFCTAACDIAICRPRAASLVRSSRHWRAFRAQAAQQLTRLMGSGQRARSDVERTRHDADLLSETLRRGSIGLAGRRAKRFRLRFARSSDCRFYEAGHIGGKERR